MELDSPDKVAKLLVNAYPSTTPAVITELSSDNVDDMINHHRGNLFTEELVYYTSMALKMGYVSCGTIITQ
ncbi:hypothetical protein [Capnocytophaga haemolytica]